MDAALPLLPRELEQEPPGVLQERIAGALLHLDAAALVADEDQPAIDAVFARDQSGPDAGC